MNLPEEELATLNVEYVLNRGNCQQLRKGQRLNTKSRLSDKVNSFIQHLLHSFNGLQSTGCSGKQLYLIKDGKQIQLKKQDTLEECGVQDNSYLVLHGYKPLSMIKYTMNVIGLDEEIIGIEVINTTSIKDLKHKLQNETGIHESEIELYHKGRKVTYNSKTVEFYGGKHSTKKLLRVKRTGNSDEDGGVQIGPALHVYTDTCPRQQTVTPCYGAVETDSPYKQQRQQRHRSASLRDKSAHGLRHVEDPVISHQREATQYSCSRNQVKQAEQQLKDEDLLSAVPDAAISNYGLVEINKEMTLNLKCFALRLRLTVSEYQEIINDNSKYESKKLEVLLKWKQKNGNEATWRRLLKEVLAENDRKLAHKIIKICHVRKNSDSVYGAVGNTDPISAEASSDL